MSDDLWRLRLDEVKRERDGARAALAEAEEAANAEAVARTEADARAQRTVIEVREIVADLTARAERAEARVAEAKALLEEAMVPAELGPRVDAFFEDASLSPTGGDDA